MAKTVGQNVGVWFCCVKTCVLKQQLMMWLKELLDLIKPSKTYTAFIKIPIQWVTNVSIVFLI